MNSIKVEKDDDNSKTNNRNYIDEDEENDELDEEHLITNFKNKNNEIRDRKNLSNEIIKKRNHLFDFLFDFKILNRKI